MTQQLTLTCKITATEHGQKLLDLLTARFAYHGPELWNQIIEAGQILLNGATAQSGQLVSSGDHLTYLRINHQEPAVETEFEVISETPELLLVGKSAGTPVSRTGIIIHNTFVNILRRHYNQEIHLLHRLDRETSGVLLCARSKESCRLYQKELSAIITGKYYLAVIRGQLQQSLVTAEQPLAIIEDSPIRCRMGSTANGKACRTVFHKIATNKEYSLVLAELITGRKHQIRAHLEHLGHPLVGDKIYAHAGKFYLKRIREELTAKDYQELGAHHHTLHAWAVRCIFPGHKEKLYFSRLFSRDMRKYLEYFPDWAKKAETLLGSLPATTGGFQKMA